MLGYIDGEMFADGTHVAIYGPALMKEDKNMGTPDEIERSKMKNLHQLHSNLDSLLVSYNIDHRVRDHVKRLMERKDNEYAAIDKVLEIINHVRLEIDGEPEDEEMESIWNLACDLMEKYTLELKKETRYERDCEN